MEFPLDISEPGTIEKKEYIMSQIPFQIPDPILSPFSSFRNFAK